MWRLDIPIENMDTKELEWHFEIPFWNTLDGYYDLTPNQVLANPEKYRDEFERTIRSNPLNQRAGLKRQFLIALRNWSFFSVFYRRYY